MDKYNNFAELKKNEEEGKDYIILSRNADSAIAVMAPHGGGIEPGTLDLADEIAGKNFLFYSFTGIKKRGNSVLHISSTSFDEPSALEIACNANTVITIHGCSDKDEIIYAGGRNHELKLAISEKLTANGFKIKNSQQDELKGKSEYNICNRCRSGKGIQLEISSGLRQKMFNFIGSIPTECNTEIFYRFVRTIREVLLPVH